MTAAAVLVRAPHAFGTAATHIIYIICIRAYIRMLCDTQAIYTHPYTASILMLC